MFNKSILLVLFCCIFFVSCATPVVPKEEPKDVSITYPIDDDLEVKVVFESQKAIDATQLGLSMLSKERQFVRIVRVEDPDFFPEYFAMVNIKIEDGLLFVSNKEAENFAKIIYLQYQKKVAPADCLKKFRERRVIDSLETEKAALPKTKVPAAE